MSPEDAAAELLETLGLSDLAAPPVDVLDIAEEHLGLDVQDHADLFALPGAPEKVGDASLSGLLFPSQQRIYVNAVEAQRSPGRRMFTIAHELGHWQMHRSDGEAVHTRFCAKEDVSGEARSPSSRQIEWEANRFAAALLMPEALLRREAAELQLNVRLLAQRFGVSAPAMQVRLSTLQLLPDYMR
ncbi:transcriptional regulator [Paraconexibacter sp. AEG42_29]|uniref:Transcriptional regulator n=2 Tax=Paraconexibacter sp. AEG42_29 TaxID=2997339 RepID=A0AAU7B1X0_9ACTN